jgi:hypothetical protein
VRRLDMRPERCATACLVCVRHVMFRNVHKARNLSNVVCVAMAGLTYKLCLTATVMKYCATSCSMSCNPQCASSHCPCPLQDHCAGVSQRASRDESGLASVQQQRRQANLCHRPVAAAHCLQPLLRSKCSSSTSRWRASSSGAAASAEATGVTTAAAAAAGGSSESSTATQRSCSTWQSSKPLG